MIEKTLVDYLNKKLDVPAHTDYQDEKTFVLIEKAGGSEENYIRSATITIQSYAESTYKASELNEMVKSTMNDIVELDTISRCKLNSDYNYTDTARKRPRYQAVYNLVYFD